jgi:bifunctional UDP-N-acetylglucosamine pyrophosphorylase/glucosamine-1-phosphate N-acetyltransferase
MEQLKAVILAAGKGTRMKSDLPKVVHTIEGKCLVDYAIDAAIGAGADDICLVVGYKHEVVEHSISHKNVKFALQEEQLGTGHAVKCARDFLGDEGQTLILFGDTPLITAETLNRLAEHHKKNGNTVTVLSAMIGDPTGYGRIPRCGRQICEERRAQRRFTGRVRVSRDQFRHVHFRYKRIKGSTR